MKTFRLLLLFTITAFSCGQTQTRIEKNNSKNEGDTIVIKRFYPNGILKAIIKLNVDSLQNGTTVWYDSIGRKSSEENFLNGKRNGTWKTFYENGNLITEDEYLNDIEIKSKRYDPDGTITSLYPIDISKIGKIQVKISNGQRDYFIKGKTDTINIYAEGLPVYNYVVRVKNASIINFDRFKYLISPIKSPKNIKIILQTKYFIGDSVTYIPIDSTEIKVK